MCATQFVALADTDAVMVDLDALVLAVAVKKLSLLLLLKLVVAVVLVVNLVIESSIKFRLLPKLYLGGCLHGMALRHLLKS